MTDTDKLRERAINDSWLSGRPYYCTECGLGMPEYIVCDDLACRLESEEAALQRLARALKEPKEGER